MTARPTFTPLKQTPPEVVLRAVAAFRAVTVDQIIGRDRTASISNARQEAVYMLREFTPEGFARIGELLGGRDTSTITHSVDSVTRRMELNAAYAGEIAQLRRAVAEGRTRPVPPEAVPVMALARRVYAMEAPPPQDLQRMANVLLTVCSIAADERLTDAEARAAITQICGVTHD